MDLNKYYDRMGEINLAALKEGGEDLLDRVIIEQGVAIRHLDRLEKGVFKPSDGVFREIDQCLERAADIAHGYDPYIVSVR